jgi:phosphate transport system permease protein
MLTAGIILAIMILPTITAISREVFQAVPHSLRESAMALGATRWETIKLAVFGPALSGIIGAVILGLGRALGETMAVTMVIGNRSDISASFFAPAYTLASVIANEFAEAVSDLNLSVLIELALILLALTILVNGFARILVWKTIGKNRIE